MSAAATTSYPFARERNLILGLLLALAALAWSLLIWQAMDMDETSDASSATGMVMDTAQPAQGMEDVSQSSMGDGSNMDMGLTMGFSAALYIGLWAAMMVAIMFPTAAPMILTFAHVQQNRQRRGQVFVPTWLFAGAYVALWSATGIIAYGVALGGDTLAENWGWLMDNAPRVGGVVLLLAGLYQLSPLKRTCLAKCRTPMGFIMTSWRDGKGGAIRMGLEHGVYCLGCCWMLFVILFPLGMMNVAAMAIITAFIFAEKVMPIGRQMATAGAVALLLLGVTVVFVPDALPTTM